MIPVVVTVLPVGGMPWNGPSCVPVAVQRATTLSPSPTTTSTGRCRSGNASKVARAKMRRHRYVDRRHPGESSHEVLAVDLVVLGVEDLPAFTHRIECALYHLLVLLESTT